MGKAKRKTYTAAFKAKVALEAIRGVNTVNGILQAYGVHPVQVGPWHRVSLDDALRAIAIDGASFDPAGGGGRRH